jgi:hypothetical protein
VIVAEMFLFVNYLEHKSRCVFQRGKLSRGASGPFQFRLRVRGEVMCKNGHAGSHRRGQINVISVKSATEFFHHEGGAKFPSPLRSEMNKQSDRPRPQVTSCVNLKLQSDCCGRNF